MEKLELKDMQSSRDYKYYKEHAQDVRLEDITSSEQNKNIIRRLRDGDSDLTALYIIDDERNGDISNEFIIEPGDDLSWLGYFIGESKMLEKICISCEMPENALVEGICRNQSIQSLEIEDDIGDYLSIGRLFGNYSNLKSLELNGYTVSGNGAHKLAVVLEQRSHLKSLLFQYMDFSTEEAAGIAKSLSAQPQLEELIFNTSEIGRGGCTALQTAFMGWGRDPKLKKLDLTSVDIDDECVQILVDGLAHCRNLADLTLSNNPISVIGLRSLATLFQSESCRLVRLELEYVHIDDDGAEVLATILKTCKLLKSLHLSNNIIGDEGVAALVSGITTANGNLEKLCLSYNRFSVAGMRSLSTLIQAEKSTLETLLIDGDINIGGDAAAVLADALANNTSLVYLRLSVRMINAVQETFSRLLCDTSSINNIYLSNHTLGTIGWYDTSLDCEKYLILNRKTRRLEPSQRELIPMCKILINHPDLADMQPFFHWKLKFLPLIVNWFERAIPCRSYFEESYEAFQRRELSAVYKFIRGVPLLVVDGYWSQQLKQIRVKKRKLEEDEKQVLERLDSGKRVSM